MKRPSRSAPAAPAPTPAASPLRLAYALATPDSPARALEGAQEVAEVLRSPALGWAHLDADHPQAAEWVTEQLSYLDPAVIETLTFPETRPRATAMGDGLLVILRGVNLNEGRDPEDMVSVRVWADDERIVTLSRQRVRAIDDLAAEMAAGQGPTTAGGFVAELVDRLTSRILPFVRDLDLAIDELEPEVIRTPGPDLRRRIVEHRLSVIELRRHVLPQRDALGHLARLDCGVISDHDRLVVSENHDDLIRVAENLDELRDNLGVLRDELAGALSDRQNKHLYTLSIISAVFLPLGFLTGHFGINLGGMPGADNPHAFWIFTGALGVIIVIQMLLLRRMRWV